MPAIVQGNAAVALGLYQALLGAAPGNLNYQDFLGGYAVNPSLFAQQKGQQYLSGPSATVAGSVLQNLGIASPAVSAASVGALRAALTEFFDAYPLQRGIVVHNLVKILAGLEGNFAFGAAAAAFNQTTAAAYVYATAAANVTDRALALLPVVSPLTTGSADVVRGTEQDDFISGLLVPVSGIDQQTLQTGDSIDGGAGTDSLRLQFNNTTAQSIRPAALTSVENLWVRVGQAATTLDLAAAVGLASVVIDDGIRAGAVRDAGASLTLANVASALTSVRLADTAAGLTVNSTATAVSGAGDAITVTLSRASGGSIRLPGYEVLNVVSTGAVSNKVAIPAPASGALVVKVTGSTSITLEDIGRATTVDASGLTGGAFLTMKETTATLAGGGITVIGSSGNDHITLSSTLNSTVDGGAGVDTIRLSGGQPSASSNVVNLRNFEILEVDTLPTSCTPSFYGGATDVVLTGSQLQPFTVNFGSGSSGLTLYKSATAVGMLNAGGSGLSDLLKLTTGDASGNISGSSFGLTHSPVIANGFETVELVAAAPRGSTVTHSFTSIAVDGASLPGRLNISGDASISIGTIRADVIDASQLRGNLSMLLATPTSFSVTLALSVTGGSGNDTLVGAQGSDTLVGGAGNDVLRPGSAYKGDVFTGGAGADIFDFSASSLPGVLANSQGTFNIARITDFAAGSDKIGLKGAGFAAVNLAPAQFIATAADLSAVYGGIQAIAASSSTASAVVVQVASGAAAGTYLYVNDTNAAVSHTADMLINVTGLAGVLTSADFSL